jgi:hypothetical protein
MHIERNERGQPICITGWNPSGLCSSCHFDGAGCCAGCQEKDDCNVVCGFLKEGGKE